MRFTSRWNWNLEMLVFSWREENRRTRRKTLGARTRTNNKLNPRMTPEPGIEPGPHWWEASALTTAPSLLPHSVPFPLLINCLTPNKHSWNCCNNSKLSCFINESKASTLGLMANLHCQCFFFPGFYNIKD